MIVVLLVWLAVGIQTVYSALPIVQMDHIKCEAQQWPNAQDAKKWHDGTPYNHQGKPKEKKNSMVKVADLFITFIGKEGKKAAVLCDIKIEGATIDAFWFTRAGDEDTDTYVFGYGEGIKDHLRFGMRGKGKETTPKMRVEIYSDNPPNSASISCGGGHEGDKCGDLWFLKLETWRIHVADFIKISNICGSGKSF